MTIRTNAFEDSRLLSREYLCFKLGVGSVMLKTIGSVPAGGVSHNPGRDVSRKETPTSILSY
jgi:hypothetical protein